MKKYNSSIPLIIMYSVFGIYLLTMLSHFKEEAIHEAREINSHKISSRIDCLSLGREDCK